MGATVMEDSSRRVEPRAGAFGNLGQVLHQLRESRGWSLEELIVRCTAPPETRITAMEVRLWEKGQLLPSLRSLELVLDALGATLLDVFTARATLEPPEVTPALYEDLFSEWRRRSQRRSLSEHWLSRVSTAEVLGAAEAVEGGDLGAKTRHRLFRHWAELLELLARHRTESVTVEVELEAVRLVNRAEGSSSARWPEEVSGPVRRIASRLQSHQRHFQRRHLGGRRRDFDLAPKVLEVVLARRVSEIEKPRKERRIPGAMRKGEGAARTVADSSPEESR